VLSNHFLKTSVVAQTRFCKSLTKIKVASIACRLAEAKIKKNIGAPFEKKAIYTLFNSPPFKGTQE
jgi:hypothetical protein